MLTKPTMDDPCDSSLTANKVLKEFFCDCIKWLGEQRRSHFYNWPKLLCKPGCWVNASGHIVACSRCPLYDPTHSYAHVCLLVSFNALRGVEIEEKAYFHIEETKKLAEEIVNRYEKADKDFPA